MSIGNARDDLSGQPLVLPEGTDNIDFLNGAWAFEKELVGPNGEILHWDFSANNGIGMATIKDSKNNIYESPMSAKMEDGVLRMHTDKFTSKTSPIEFGGEFIECRNGPNGAICKGSDGFGEWDGERIFSASAQGQQTQPTQAATNQAQAMAAAEEKVTDLAADAPELPEEVMQNTRKATMNTNGDNVKSLAGHWRYSRDLARKADGEPVFMEFHIDENGNGYSLIKGDPDGEFRADATAMQVKDGVLRIKTDSYTNGKGQAYNPTFLECQAQAGQALDCNLSNGWLRVDNGRLLDITSYEQNMAAPKMEEMLPSTGGEATQAAGLNMDDIFANAAEEAQKAAQTAPAQQKGQANLQLPTKGDSVSFMQGKWICHTGLYSTANGQPVVLEFTFDQNGKGSSKIVERSSGQAFNASAQASFRNGILRVNTSQFRGRRGAYEANYIECRNQNGVAVCRGKNGKTIWNANFMRP